MGLEESSISEDVFGLPEGADKIFVAGCVDRGFASDIGINYREQGGWYLNEFDASNAVR